MSALVQPMVLSGAEVWPLIEGGKGVAVSNGRSSGAWAAAGGVGTFSGVNPDLIDENGEYVPSSSRGATARRATKSSSPIRSRPRSARPASPTRRARARAAST